MAMKCKFCGSQETFGSRKGVDGTKALAGFFLAGPLGAIWGTSGSNGVVVSCNSCGKSWTVTTGPASNYTRKELKLNDYSESIQFGNAWFAIWGLSLLWCLMEGWLDWLYFIGIYLVMPTVLYLLGKTAQPIVGVYKRATIALPIVAICTVVYCVFFTEIIYNPNTQKGRMPTLSEWMLPGGMFVTVFISTYVWWHKVFDEGT